MTQNRRPPNGLRVPATVHQPRRRPSEPRVRFGMLAERDAARLDTGDIDGVLPLANGGTGASTGTTALDNLFDVQPGDEGKLATVVSGSMSLAPLDDGVITPAKLADADFGAFTVAFGIASLDANTVNTTEIKNLAVTPAKVSVPFGYVAASEAGAPVRTVGASSTALFTMTDLAVPASSNTDWAATLEILGQALNNSGSANGIRFKTTFGSTVVTNSNYAGGISNSAVKLGFRLRIQLRASGSTSAQHAMVEWAQTGSYASAGGVGSFHHYAIDGGAWGTSAEDATSSKNLKVEGQWTNSHASSYFEIYSARLVFCDGAS